MMTISVFIKLRAAVKALKSYWLLFLWQAFWIFKCLQFSTHSIYRPLRAKLVMSIFAHDPFVTETTYFCMFFCQMGHK